MTKETPHIFSIDVSTFPLADRPGIARAIADQGCHQVGSEAVNTVLHTDGKIVVYLLPGTRWLAAAGFEAAVKHWLLGHEV